MLRKATRQQTKIRLGLSAVSGAGKTYSSLFIGKGLANGDFKKVAIIDSENGSADLYAHLGEYNVYPIAAPFTPESYIAAIKDCENEGMEVIIIDSISHEWDGPGGILDIHSDMTGNSFTNWKFVTPRHQAFITAILQSKCHTITTVRRKQEYEIGTNQNGKITPTKVGLKEVTREGFEYELTVNLELDTSHNATAAKDRTSLFENKPPFVPTEETGAMILEWCKTGIDVKQVIQEAIDRLSTCQSRQELLEIKSTLPNYITTDPIFKEAGNYHYAQLLKPQQSNLTLH